MKIREINIKNNQSRLLKLDFENKTLTTPTYFPSISSVEKNKHFVELVNLILERPHPQMLISAYDYRHYFKKNKKLASSINNYSKNHFLFVDSGGYELFWNPLKKWTFDLYKKTILEIKSDLHTSYDEENNSNKKMEDIFNSIIDDGSLHPSSQYMPIFHANDSKQLVKTIKKFLDVYPYAIRLLAVRERELGFSLYDRAKTIFEIRKLLKKTGGNQLLHILGAGHPLSIALYSYCGADSFDSTDWYTHVLDHSMCILRDISQLELVYGVSPSIDKNENSHRNTLVHNLDSYIVLMNKIQAMIRENKLKQYLIKQDISKSFLTKVTT